MLSFIFTREKIFNTDWQKEDVRKAYFYFFNLVFDIFYFIYGSRACTNNNRFTKVRINRS